MKKLKIYLAGPMTGLPEFNYSAFNTEAARLRAAGYSVENPAEVEAPAPSKWTDYMRRSITKMMRCNCVAKLPGWKRSRGARIEVWLGRLLGFKVVQVECL